MKVSAENDGSVLTPLGASLDDQSSSPSKGPLKNGCSFEDDLSLGAEANHLQNNSTKPSDPGYSMPAKEKRSQFKQKGRSMNSTGSGKSSGTVSSVSELLDLYEEDPEEILYNLGFGREEPDIASKIPSRFFNSPSSAKGIDIKVYLGAQMQRMELDNPNYALTSRFRQTEVLATVANVFSEIYSQVSGRPLQRIGTKETEPKEPPLLRSNSSALNAAKILKKSLTRPNLLNATEGGHGQPGATSDPVGVERGSLRDLHSDSEPKPQKVFWKKDSSPHLATVTEETLQGAVSAVEGKSALTDEALAGEPPPILAAPVVVNVTDVSEKSGDAPASESAVSEDKEGQKTVPSSTLDRDTCSLFPNPHMNHLRTEPRDSFEMEELPSNDDEAVPGTHCISRAGSENLLRTASQQSDSSGFAEDPSTDGSANPNLKVQESSDSCDSETTVTSHAGGVSTPLALEHPAFEKLQGDEGHLGLAGVAEDVPTYISHQVPRHEIPDQSVQETESSADGSETQILSDRLFSSVETSSSIESGSTVTVESGDTGLSVDSASAGASVDMMSEGAVGSTTEHDGTAGRDPSLPSMSSTTLDTGVEPDSSLKRVGPQSQRGRGQILTNSEKVRSALLRAEQRSSSVCEDRVGRVWVRRKDLFRDRDDDTRNPLRRSSSLPNALLSPTRVVSSVRIQLGGGSVRHCTPPAYCYKYEEERERDEVDSIAEEDEYAEEAQSTCRSALLIKQTSTESESFRMPPYPLNVPPHLTRSASSLYSVPADWPMRRLAEGPVWSTNSVPDLTHTATPHATLPQQSQHHLPHYRGGASSLYHPNKPVNYPSHGVVPGSISSPLTHTQSPLYAQYTQPQDSLHPHSLHGVPFPQPNMPYNHSHSIPYGPSAPFHSTYGPSVPLNAPYGSTYNVQGGPYNPYSPLTNSHSAPNSLLSNCAPCYPHMPYGHQYSGPFTPPPAPFPCGTATPPPAMGSTEMQLRRVLHEIRGTVHSLNQSPSVQRDGTPLGTQSPHQAAQPLYEELQMRRRSLNVFRTQMMDLELALMRQQSTVYQHFSPEERREAEQLQRLRAAVRQELQELELQVEDRLLTLSDQLRSSSSSRLCRHPLGMVRGHSMDSLSSSSALRAMEPVTDLLREQLYLQSELGYDGSLSAAATPISGRSSRAESPSRSTRNSDHYCPSPQRGGLYRASVNITPTVPRRPGLGLSQAPPAESQEQTMSPNLSEGRGQRWNFSVSPQEDQASTTSEDIQFQEERRGGNSPAHLQQFIQEIKQSLAEEIRQEIVNELLAAVSPRRSPVVAREPPA
ncbi:protein ITPRID2 isoform X2 [Pygocentrus nattereri]|uniref:protein ITPRID2 isoform X2 n=1 Tax=Pygocentrus nattereri TaxID=42514 RepID=UPI001890F7E5|nr:protein ITPRID2 isoform X2 [Pygocentrus nattereri]